MTVVFFMPVFSDFSGIIILKVLVIIESRVEYELYCIVSLYICKAEIASLFSCSQLS